MERVNGGFWWKLFKKSQNVLHQNYTPSLAFQPSQFPSIVYWVFHFWSPTRIVNYKWLSNKSLVSFFVDFQFVVNYSCWEVSDFNKCSWIYRLFETGCTPGFCNCPFPSVIFVQNFFAFIELGSVQKLVVLWYVSFKTV